MPPGDFSDQIIERYLKFKALAEHPSTDANEARVAKRRLSKLQQQHPGLKDHAEQLLRDVKRAEAEQRFAEAYGVGRVPEPGPGASLIEKGLYWAWKAGLSGVTRGLGLDELEEAAEEAFARRGGRKRKPPPPPVDRRPLKTLLYEEVGVGELDISEDEHGAFLHLDLDIPLDLWERVCAAKVGPQRFVEWINEVAEDDALGAALDPDLEP